jgi:hypothetical protein
MENQIKQIPKIQQQPRQASNTAIHYGYIAFKDIELAGPLGIEHKVQPDTSPYYKTLPCRELLPFTNIIVHEVDEKLAATTSFMQKANPVVAKQKNAKECVTEMQFSYEVWGFATLDVLTGYSEDEAFHIFQTVQPFTFKLVDLLDELEFAAAERIDKEEPYKVEYDGQSFTLEPLPAHLKEVARSVQAKMLGSAEIAVALGEDTREKTVQAMTQYFSTGTGKRRADPLDNYIFKEFKQEIPKLIGKDEKGDEGGALQKLADILTGNQKQSELEKELAELKELKEQLKAQFSQPVTIESEPITVGKAVTVGGQTATVVAKPFGKVKVEFEDGSTRTVTKEEIQ